MLNYFLTHSGLVVVANFASKIRVSLTPKHAHDFTFTNYGDGCVVIRSFKLLGSLCGKVVKT